MSGRRSCYNCTHRLCCAMKIDLSSLLNRFAMIAMSPEEAKTMGCTANEQELWELLPRMCSVYSPEKNS